MTPPISPEMLKLAAEKGMESAALNPKAGDIPTFADKKFSDVGSDVLRFEKDSNIPKFAENDADTSDGQAESADSETSEGDDSADTAGEQDANEAKIQGALHANSVVAADEETVKRVTGADVGFAGPVGLKEKIKIIADKQIYSRVNLICGANKTDCHITGIDPERDFKADLVADITFAKVGEKCPHCDGVLEQYKGIEVGQVFHLGTKYSKPMHCIFLDKNGKESTAVMGCYGIGVTRTLAAFIEQNHDDKGIIWSPAVAPFEVEVIRLQDERCRPYRIPGSGAGGSPLCGERTA